MAARCCWSTSCRVSARQPWSIARAEAGRERAGEGTTTGIVVATVARSRLVVDDGRCFRNPDRGRAALVDLAGLDLRGGVSGVDGAVLRRQGFPAIAATSGLRPADRAVGARARRN